MARLQLCSYGNQRCTRQKSEVHFFPHNTLQSGVELQPAFHSVHHMLSIVMFMLGPASLQLAIWDISWPFSHEHSTHGHQHQCHPRAGVLLLKMTFAITAGLRSKTGMAAMMSKLCLPPLPGACKINGSHVVQVLQIGLSAGLLTYERVRRIG